MVNVGRIYRSLPMFRIWVYGIGMRFPGMRIAPCRSPRTLLPGRVFMNLYDAGVENGPEKNDATF